MAGAMLGHYIANAATKLVINIAMVDAAGAAANVTVTSPATSLAHALYEGFSQVLPGLEDGKIWEAIQEAFNTPEANEALQHYAEAILSLPETDGYNQLTASDDVRFGRSLQPLEWMADCQGNRPICGVEGGVENPVQAAYPWVGNDISDRIVELMPQVADIGLPWESYQSLLWQNGIQSQWTGADLNIMFHTVVQPGCGVVIHGDPHFINPDVFPSLGSYHTVFLSEPWYDSAGNPLGYIGIDSASYSLNERIGHWTFEQVQRMIQGAPQNPYKGSVLLTAPIYQV
jgi:hypothetical protein